MPLRFCNPSRSLASFVDETLDIQEGTPQDRNRIKAFATVAGRKPSGLALPFRLRARSNCGASRVAPSRCSRAIPCCRPTNGAALSGTWLAIAVHPRIWQRVARRGDHLTGQRVSSLSAMPPDAPRPDVGSRPRLQPAPITNFALAQSSAMPPDAPRPDVGSRPRLQPAPITNFALAQSSAMPPDAPRPDVGSRPRLQPAPITNFALAQSSALRGCPPSASRVRAFLQGSSRTGIEAINCRT